MIKKINKLNLTASLLFAFLCGASAATISSNQLGGEQSHSYAVNVTDSAPAAAVAPSVIAPVYLAREAQSQVDYLDEITAEGKYTWKKDRFPLKVYIKPDQTVPGFRNNMPDMVRSSFNEWTESLGGKISWAEVSSPEQADITVGWTALAEDHGRGTEGGRTRTFARINHATNLGTIDKAEMTLLTRLPYGSGELGDNEIKRAYLHEVGHAFGLTGHSSTRSDVMYYAVGPRQGASLGERDVATMKRLYDGYPELSSRVHRNDGV